MQVLTRLLLATCNGEVTACSTHVIGVYNTVTKAIGAMHSNLNDCRSSAYRVIKDIEDVSCRSHIYKYEYKETEVTIKWSIIEHCSM